MESKKRLFSGERWKAAACFAYLLSGKLWIIRNQEILPFLSQLTVGLNVLLLPALFLKVPLDVADALDVELLFREVEALTKLQVLS